MGWTHHFHCAEQIRVILDTDANNELDDQHAMAYLIFNGDVFDFEAITVNRRRAGGGVDQHLAEAVNFMIQRAKDPSIIPQVRVVWLGSNYPKRGEYNKGNDVGSLNYILETEVECEIATVRYGQPAGTDAVGSSIRMAKRLKTESSAVRCAHRARIL